MKQILLEGELFSVSMIGTSNLTFTYGYLYTHTHTKENETSELWKLLALNRNCHSRVPSITSLQTSQSVTLSLGFRCPNRTKIATLNTKLSYPSNPINGFDPFSKIHALCNSMHLIW